jgi:Domain of unknown function (DUF4394)/Calx-beta domain
MKSDRAVSVPAESEWRCVRMRISFAAQSVHTGAGAPRAAEALRLGRSGPRRLRPFAPMRAALVLALALVASLPPAAEAARIVAMTGDGTSLIAVDSASPSVLVPPPGRTSAAAVAVTGIPSDETVVGIDYRVRDGALFAVTKRESAQALAFLYRINTAAGEADQVNGDLEFPEDTSGGVDFSSADSIEAAFRTGTQDHHLFHSETGVQSLLAPLDYPASATDPRVSGLALDPSTGTVYALDDNLDLLARLGGPGGSPPSGGGQLTPIGPTGVAITPFTGFDVSASGQAFVSHDVLLGSQLHPIDLTTGAMSSGVLLGPTPVDYPGIAVVPSGLLSVADVTVTEDGGAALVRVERRAGSVGSVGAQLATADGSATAGADYTPVTQAIDLAPGETSETVALPIANDGAAEGRETLSVQLSSPSGGAELERASATVTIADDDSAPGGGGPGATPDTTRPVVALGRLPRSLRLRRLLGGVVVRLTPNEPVAFELELRGSARRVQLSRTFNVILARRALGPSAAPRRVRLRPNRRLVGRPRRFTALLRVTATDAAGNRTVAQRRIRVRR